MLLKSIGSDWLCKLLSRKICKAFFSIVHLLRLYFRQASMECCPTFFRFVRHFWSPGGSCYQNSVKACPTIQSLVWSQRFWSVEISDVSSPFSNTAKRSKEVWNGYFHEDAETFGDRIRLSSILRNINQRIFWDFCCDAFLDTHTSGLAAACWLSWWDIFATEKKPKILIDTC